MSSYQTSSTATPASVSARSRSVRSSAAAMLDVDEVVDVDGDGAIVDCGRGLPPIPGPDLVVHRDLQRDVAPEDVAAPEVDDLHAGDRQRGLGTRRP